MAFPALLDTCTLYGYHLCDLILRLAEARTFRPLWSDDILKELESNLISQAGNTDQQVRHRVAEMKRHFPDAEIEEYAALIPVMTCDAKDRHVLAAAVRANVEVIVTFNLRDFPKSSVEPYDIRVLHPDEFLLDQLDLYPDAVLGSLRRQVDSYRNPPIARDELFSALTRAGVPNFVEAARLLL